MEPSSETTAPRYLKLLQTQLPPFYLYLSLDAIDAVCHQFGHLGTNLHLIPCAVLSRLSTRASSSFPLFLSYTIYVSGNHRLVIFLPSTLTACHVLPEPQT